KKAHPAHKIADQKTADKDVVAAVAKVPYLASYLASSFSLSKGQAPHTLQF
ncbi:60S ribosomal protein L6, partial [Coemansia sp. RSA 638]